MSNRWKNLVVLYLLAVAAGCGASPQRARVAPPTRSTGEAWAFDGTAGRKINTDHYSIYTTITDPRIQQTLATVMEGALVQYQKFTPGLKLSPKPMECYVFAKRAQWAAFTRDKTGVDAAIYLQINRGGYTVRDWYVAYLISEIGTYAVAAHEGWHQYVARNFKSRLPPFLEEGIATMFETIVWENGRPRWDLSVNPMRAQKLHRAIDTKSLWKLNELITMHAGDVVGMTGERIETFYAQNWAFAMFLWEGDGGRHRAAEQRMLNDLAAGTTPEAAGVRPGAPDTWNPQSAQPLLEYYLGMKLPQIEQAYLEYVFRIASSTRQASGPH